MIKMPKEDRHYQRRTCHTPVIIGFIDREGAQKFLSGTCVEISGKGVLVRSEQLVPFLSYVTVSMEEIKIEAVARVRHLSIRNGSAMLGLELREPLPVAFVDRISKEAFAIQKPPSA